MRISPADNNDAVDVIAYRLRHLHYLRQVVLRATLTVKEVAQELGFSNPYNFSRAFKRVFGV
ncbi:MAG: helix-turn-helix domain-containing protein [Verrucomicrobia bacterium]|nr:helix-turn-helix domain-containing protein [Verrucomicrobiota bacterium]